MCFKCDFRKFALQVRGGLDVEKVVAIFAAENEATELAEHLLQAIFTQGKSRMKYQVKIRFRGHVSWVETDANNAAQAKELVRQQYGPAVEVIYCKVAGKQ
jgi:hypothetical protein